ncbi:NVEALA domain-containing protein, partial [uncultured Bacteroides sp.]
MKKKIMGLIAIVAIAVVAGYNIYTSQSNMRMSALVLANVEALARYELPDVE